MKQNWIFFFTAAIFMVFGCSVSSGVKSCKIDADCSEDELCLNEQCTPISEIDGSLDSGDSNECTDGQSRCLDTSTYQICALSGGVWKWGEAQTCGAHQACDTDSCQGITECAVGQTVCAEDKSGVKSCTQGENNATYYSDAVPCPPDGYGQAAPCYATEDAGLSSATCCTNNCQEGVFQCIPGGASGSLDYQKCLKDGATSCIYYLTKACGENFNCLYAANMCSSNELAVSSNPNGFQWLPQAAKIDNNRFVVAWSSSLALVDLIRLYEVEARILDSQGNPINSDFYVNQYTTNNQWLPQIGVIDATRFAIVWQSYQQSNNYYGIYGRIFDSNGNGLTSEFPINTFTTFSNVLPQIEVMDSSQFIVVWQSSNTNGKFESIWSRAFTRDGVPKSSTERAINDLLQKNLLGFIHFHLKRFDSTKLAVVWNLTNMVGQLTPFSTYHIEGRILDSNGSPVTSEFRISQYTASVQDFPEIEILESNKFAVIWAGIGQDGSLSAILGRIISDQGAYLSSEFIVNSYTTGYQFLPYYEIGGDHGFDHRYFHQIKKIDSDRFVVAWTSAKEDLSSLGVYGKLFDFNGVALSSEIALNTSEINGQSWPQLASLESQKQWMAVWQENHADFTSVIKGAVFDRTGSRVSSEFQINTAPLRWVNLVFWSPWPLIESIGPNRLVILWNYFPPLQFDSNISGQIYYNE